MVARSNSEHIEASVAAKPPNISNIEAGNKFERRKGGVCFVRDWFFWIVGIFLNNIPRTDTAASNAGRKPRRVISPRLSFVIYCNRDQNERKA
jgi:hypothetical protein